MILSGDVHKNVNGVPYANTIEDSHSSVLGTMQEIFKSILSRDDRSLLPTNGFVDTLPEAGRVMAKTQLDKALAATRLRTS